MQLLGIATRGSVPAIANDGTRPVDTPDGQVTKTGEVLRALLHGLGRGFRRESRADTLLESTGGGEEEPTSSPTWPGSHARS